MRLTITVLVLLFTTLAATSQDTLRYTQDNEISKKHSPKKAALFSAALPGLGQAYNKKYWKIPVIYAALGGFFYFAQENQREYLRYRDAYRIRTDGDPLTLDEFLQHGDVQILSAIDFYRKKRDLNYIVFAAVYILNILDASVDAHFFKYDISDELSLRIVPSLVTGGISITLKL